MAVAALFWLIVIIGVVIAVACVLVSRSGTGLSREQKNELLQSRLLIKEIEKTARRHRDVYPEMSQIVIDLIDESSIKELS